MNTKLLKFMRNGKTWTEAARYIYTIRRMEAFFKENPLQKVYLEKD